MLVGRCAGDRSAKRLRLLAEASLQHCLLAAAAAAEEEQQQQQERAAQQLCCYQRGEKAGSAMAEHAGVWGQPVTPRADAEADLLQRAAADAVRLAEEKCQVRLVAASPDLLELQTCWPGNQDTASGVNIEADVLVVAALSFLCCAAGRLQPMRPGAQSRTLGMPKTCRATLVHSARTTSPPATCPAAACAPRR